MKNIALHTLLLLLVGLSSCKKNELPEPVASTPVVWVQGELNTIPFKLEAGNEAAFIHTTTNVINEYLREFVFTIESPALKKSLQISIYSSQDTLTALTIDLERSIKPGIYKFAYSNSSIYMCKNSEVVISYSELNTGHKFNTIPYDQDISGNFEIVAVSDTVHQGTKYKMAEVRFNCNVKNYLGQTYNITNGHGYIPFGGESK